MPKKNQGPYTKNQYMNMRSWLVDTAETPKDQKNLKKDLKKLDSTYKKNKQAMKTEKKRDGVMSQRKKTATPKVVKKTVSRTLKGK
jgi:hypothetical protein